MDTVQFTIRKAERDDIDRVIAFITPFVQQHKLLPRTLDELDQLVDTLFIAEQDGEIVGCAALEIYSSKLAELRSLAVRDDLQGKGVGRGLVAACIELARQRRILEVMAITSREEFFKACGFGWTLTGERKALFVQTRDDDDDGTG
ncbi:MAG: GNAT family N-acetyltransferase [Anaerolineaceae bacterium]|nr:MAG: GNAT family N-acetyltransferase [Anaerolineaceae bacterium]